MASPFPGGRLREPGGAPRGSCPLRAARALRGASSAAVLCPTVRPGGGRLRVRARAPAIVPVLACVALPGARRPGDDRPLGPGGAGGRVGERRDLGAVAVGRALPRACVALRR